MVINRAQIKDRIESLKAGLQSIELQITKLQFDREATAGAIQDCEHWLAICDSEETAQ